MASGAGSKRLKKASASPSKEKGEEKREAKKSQYEQLMGMGMLGPTVTGFLKAAETAALVGRLSKVTAKAQTERQQQCCAQTNKGRRCLLLTQERKGERGGLTDYCRDFCGRHISQVIKQALLTEPSFLPQIFINDDYPETGSQSIEVDAERPPKFIWFMNQSNRFNEAMRLRRRRKKYGNVIEMVPRFHQDPRMKKKSCSFWICMNQLILEK
jgi:hypothetical protein